MLRVYLKMINNERDWRTNMGLNIKYIALFCNSYIDEMIEQQDIKIKVLSFFKTF